MRRTGRTQRGFTLVEILVAMTLTLAVFAITLPFVRAQTRALGASAGRLDADQLARYAQRAIDRDLRLASADPGQPLLVYAGPMGIAFNANLLTADSLADPSAAAFDAAAPNSLAEGWRVADAGPLPFDEWTYPTEEYLDASGGPSHHETIAYFLHPDTISGRSDLYVLYRRVNARDSIQVVRSLQVPAESAFFSYLRPVGGALQRIADARLPLRWDSTAVDSIAAVGLRVTGYFRERLTGKETLRTVHWRTPLPNAGAPPGSACGAAPGAPADLDVEDEGAHTDHFPNSVELDWDRSGDDGIGAADVRHYIVERRRGAGAWTTLASVPATGATRYVWHHMRPGNGTYTYGVRAVDCGGTASTRTTDGAVTLP